MRRLLILCSAVAVGVPCSLAAAAALQGVSPSPVASGSGSVAQCDTDGFTVTYTTSGGNVTSVAIGGIAAACNGGSLQVTLVNGSRESLASGGPVTVSGPSQTLTVSPQPRAANVAGTDISVAGA